ncbi:MAG TPA: hypothetical protein VGM47_02995 [Gammaproteobacteria bacterium]|jgi:hypothetical protein
MQQRSIFITVVGWVFAGLAILGLVNCLMFLFMPLDKLAAELPQPPGGTQVDPALFINVMRGVFLVIFAVLAWVLLSAIGLIMRKPWARVSMMVLLGIGIAWNLLYVIIGVTGGPAGMGAMLQGMGGTLAVMGLIFIAVFAGAIQMLRSEKVRREFQPKPKP